MQLNHRILATTTFLVVVAFWIGIRGWGLTRRASTAANWLLAALFVQVTLGVFTLLYGVPIILAAGHQAVAMLLFTAALNLTHCLRDTAQVNQ